MMGLSDNTKIGILLISLGFLFLFLGVMLFFDAGLMAIGNILLLLGFPFIIGFKRTLVFFNPIRRKDKWRGIVLFFLGIALVLRKNTFIGFILESIGMFAMFGAFLPIVVQFLRNTPFIGPIFSAPGVSSVVDKIAGVARRPPV